MSRLSIPNQVNLLPSAKSPTQSPDFYLNFDEQACLSLIRSCNSMQNFKQVQAQMLKLGLFWDSFHASNLVATCALSQWGSMEYACSIFSQIEKPSTFCFNFLIRGYTNVMEYEQALLVYIEMFEVGVVPDKFTYPHLLKACALLGALEEGRQIHGHVEKLDFEGDIYVQNSLINMYGKCGDIESARQVFDKICERSIASWSAIIGAHASLGLWWECLLLFWEMNSKGGLRAEESTLVSVLSACTHLGARDLGRSIHGFLLRNITELNVIVQTSLIDMYVKCGCLEKALCLFSGMNKRNQLSYSVMISGLAVHGQGKEALRVFSQMLEEAIEPDNITYVGVLSACSRAGLVDEGLELFDRMKSEHGFELDIEIYGCIVDLVARVGKLNEAYEFIKTMHIKPNDVVWRSLLNACKVHNNLELGAMAAENIFRLNPNHTSDYVVLSSMYAQANRWDEVARVRTEMIEKGLTQTPGASWVEVKRKVYKFVSQDMFQPQCDRIHEMIHQMEWQLKFDGYSPDISQVLHDVDEEEKKERLKCHSQKLALAFALINTSQGSPIRIVRNLRMCNDCHTYTKFISVIYGREITVRDRNQFHQFKDGTCSCRDYW